MVVVLPNEKPVLGGAPPNENPELEVVGTGVEEGVEDVLPNESPVLGGVVPPNENPVLEVAELALPPNENPVLEGTTGVRLNASLIGSLGEALGTAKRSEPETQAMAVGSSIPKL